MQPRYQNNYVEVNAAIRFLTYQLYTTVVEIQRFNKCSPPTMLKISLN